MFLFQNISTKIMRKFILEKVGSSGGLERTTTCSLNGLSAVITPSIWILTKSGAIPTLTPETVEMGGLSADSEMFAGLLVPLQDLIKSADVFQSYQKGEILLSIKFRKFYFLLFIKFHKFYFLFYYK